MILWIECGHFRVVQDSKQIGLDLERFSAVWRHVENRGEIEEVFER